MKIRFNLFLENRAFYIFGALLALYVAGYFIPVVIPFVHWGLVVWAAAILWEALILYRGSVSARRHLREKWSNGDDNPVRIEINGDYPMPVSGYVLDEAPVVFQMRHNQLAFSLHPGQTTECGYLLHPVRRGNFEFGAINIFVHTKLGMVVRRFVIPAADTAAVYPSLMQMRRYAFMAVSASHAAPGLKKIRRVGHTMEFDQIREYVRGDDYRTINWKATARRQKLMRNQYEDERSQDIYCVIDAGRSMKMPFKGLSLLDYAVNAALALSNIIIRKEDKAGLIVFEQTPATILPASNRPGHLNRILQNLYALETGFMEPDFEKLYAVLNHQVKHRGLIMLFTNFESLSSLQRQLPILQKINRRHLLVVIFFRNRTIEAMLDPAHTNKDILLKTMAEKMIFEKQRISAELTRHGIQNLRVFPDEISVAAINRYLEIKSRRTL